MKKKSASQSAFFNLRLLLSFVLCSIGLLLAIFGFAGTPWRPVAHSDQLPRYMPVPGGGADDLDRMEVEWNNRLTYPTGRFNPAWVRAAAARDALIPRGVPSGLRGETSRAGICRWHLTPIALPLSGRSRFE